MVIAYPLYVDCLPSHLLAALKYIEENIKNKKLNVKVYQIVNNGFYDAMQNNIAIDIVWKWCEKCNLKNGTALGVGAGEMVQVADLGTGPSTNLGHAIDDLINDIKEGNTRDTVYVEPNFPRFLYRMSAHMTFKSQARKNGLNISEIKSRL